jgi:peptidoglycan-associated lipoprotein
MTGVRPGRYVAVASVAAALTLAGCAKEPVTLAASDPRSGAFGARGRGLGGGAGSGDRHATAGRPDDLLGEVAVGSDGGSTAANGSAARGDRAGASADGRASGEDSTARRPDPRAFTEVPELPDIYFEFDRYDIQPEAARRLRAHVEWLRARPGDLLLIEGHCDERGTEEYNLALGEHRAESTKNYLIAQGIAPARIAIISYGEFLPVCADRHEACWALNRRAHFLVKRQ